MICPGCGTRQYGAASRCSNCHRDLLPGRSPRQRYYASLAAVGLIPVVAFFVVAINRLPLGPVWLALAGLAILVMFAVAAIPISVASRYRRRALAMIFSDPEQAVRDLTQAFEFDSRWRELLIDRARALRMIGEDAAAIDDLRFYLERTAGERRETVTRARVLLQQIETGVAVAPLRRRVASPRIVHAARAPSVSIRL